MEKINKKYLIIVLVIVALCFGGGVQYGRYISDAAQAEDAASLELQGGAANSAEEKSGNIYVHIVGAVQKPGLLKLPAESRLSEAIEKAETTEEADLSLVNLARALSDGEKIYVPKKSEAAEPGVDEATAMAEGKYSVQGDASTSQSTTDASTTSASSGGTSASASNSGSSSSNASSASGSSTKVLSGPVNINTANSSELQRLNGIGPAKAEAIIAYRNEHGRFNSVDDLINVSGIGEKTLEKLRSNVVVD